MFVTTFDKILEKVNRTDPVKYARTRNYIDGAVTRLSPYISRGVISTRYIFKSLLKRGFELSAMEKFVQELLWRDYWQQIWIAKGEAIDTDLKQTQDPVENFEIPENIVQAKTGIKAVDTAISEFYRTGYLHNHMRMYIAALACNVARSHWKVPARWMYYHLLDADWASNALSWQWVAGANSRKKYVANQDNINKYCYTQQKGSFIDIAYEDFRQLPVPEALSETCMPELKTELPEETPVKINNALPTLIYNFYNLDPLWKKDIKANRILLLEPSHFKKYPVSDKTIAFVLELAKNIDNIQLYTGEFSALKTQYDLNETHYKSHPLSKHYTGKEDSRDWIVEDVKGYYPSFFAYWKKCVRKLKAI